MMPPKEKPAKGQGGEKSSNDGNRKNNSAKSIAKIPFGCRGRGRMRSVGTWIGGKNKGGEEPDSDLSPTAKKKRARPII